MKFAKEFLQERIFEDLEQDEIIDHGRWSVRHRVIFSFDGRFYQTQYNVPATESQDERPFEYDGDEIECPEVHRVKKTMEVWEPVNP